MAEELASLIARSMASVGSHLEADVLGATDPAAVAAAIAAAVADLGTVASARFYEAGVGIVAGIELGDGAPVVVKVHRYRATLERLAACVAVQAHLHAAGLPAPEPLLPARALGTGVVTVESLRSGGTADGRDPAVRAGMARLLHRFVAAARPLVDAPGLVAPYLPTSRDEELWPEPHDLRFDFAATAGGAEWIDALARPAVEVLAAATLPPVIGHDDWRTQNLAFEGPEIVAIYDWDSLTRVPEPWVVGAAAASFCIDWREAVVDPPPSLAEMRAFVADYETARGEAFTAVEREVLDAANVRMIAYSARCQHSDQQLRPDLGDNDQIGWPRLLRERGGLGGLT